MKLRYTQAEVLSIVQNLTQEKGVVLKIQGQQIVSFLFRGDQASANRVVAFCQRLGIRYEEPRDPFLLTLRLGNNNVDVYIPPHVEIELRIEEIDWRQSESIPEDFYAA